MVIGMGVLILDKSTASFQSLTPEVGETVTGSLDFEYTQYDGVLLKGDKLIKLYQRYHLEKLQFDIATKETMRSGTPRFHEISESTPVTDSKYINQEGDFLIELVVLNSKVSGFRCTQQ